ncbi:hypothetical protein B0H14DRAFT_3474049 [Mycena olivaceomarginata]|nr:hypothetical protein B0H14DRAFT_3474049 [Mycena olivaceomarginata]
MAFPFTLLPTELAHEIICIAALPDYDDASAPRPSYATAVSMASVSVVLASSPQVLSFIESILLQKHLSASPSRLALDYPKLVRRFWATECWEPLMEHSPDYYINSGALYKILCGVDSLGLHFRSLHLLYNGLASAGADPARDWTCTHVTLAGSLPRWKPLTSSTEGLLFLSRISHLTLWISTERAPPMHESRVPSWIEDVPFWALPNLTHFAFPLRAECHQAGCQVPTETLVYVAPMSVDFKPSVFCEWALDDDPVGHGVVVPFLRSPPVPRVVNNRAADVELGWESAFMAGESEAGWEAGEQASQKVRRVWPGRNSNLD